jgi:hypothetical protein
MLNLCSLIAMASCYAVVCRHPLILSKQLLARADEFLRFQMSVSTICLFRLTQAIWHVKESPPKPVGSFPSSQPWTH